MAELIESEFQNKTYVFCDVETSSLCLHNIYNLPWQVSLLIARNNKIIDKKNWYIKWDLNEFQMSKDAAAITHYNQDFIDKNGVEANSFIGELDQNLKDCDYVVGHNILGFDIYLINSLYRKLNKKLYNWHPKSIDTLCLAKGMKLENFPKSKEDFNYWQQKMVNTFGKHLRGLSLGALAKDLGIVVDESKLHDASFDLELNFEVFKIQKKNFNF